MNKELEYSLDTLNDRLYDIKEIRKDELELKKRKQEIEEYSKDRTDIALKDYIKMKDMINSLQNELNTMSRFMAKVSEITQLPLYVLINERFVERLEATRTMTDNIIAIKYNESLGKYLENKVGGEDNE